MTLLVQITDTHILPPGELLYGNSDTASHLRETITAIQSMRPAPDIVMITGDLAERADEACYNHFIELISPLEMPVFVIPGNHDDTQRMPEFFAGTPYFPCSDPTGQYTIEGYPFRILALNSRLRDSELAEFDEARLNWLRNELEASDLPTLIAIHHPPMKTGIEFIDMGGTDWFQGLKEVLNQHSQVKLVICGHCHTDLIGHIGRVPVYMAGSAAHQLVAARSIDIAPSFLDQPAPPVLHHYLDGEFLSGSHPWPANTEEKRIDRESGMTWEALKNAMRGPVD
jgi:3',5'-cyclic AMP phosphodiesterase CpdA